MPDTGFQASVMDGIARVVGGTVTPGDSHFYSGDIAGDGTGVSGLKGCYSAPPNGLQSTPVGVVYPGRFTATLQAQGEEENEDTPELFIYVARYSDKNQMAILTPFRDTIPAAFRAHMQLFGAASVLDAFPIAGEPGIHAYGGPDQLYLAWRFTIRVRRLLSVTYTA